MDKSKKHFADLFKDLLSKVSEKDHGLFTGLEAFYKGIGEMEWAELMSGGQALMSVKENIALTMTGVNPALGERRNRWIKKIEHAFRVRILMLANEPHEIINMGMSRWEEAIAVFGKEFFDNVQSPVVVQAAPTSAAPAASTPVVETPNPSPNVNGLNEVKIKEMFENLKVYVDQKLQPIRSGVNDIKTPKIPGGLMFAVWASLMLNVAGIVFLVFFLNPSVKEIKEDLSGSDGSVKNITLKVKSRVEAHDKSFKRDSIALVSIQDTLNVRLPKAKAKK